MTDLILDGVKNSAAVRPDMPAEVARRFEAVACESLDRLFSAAKNFK